MNRSQDCLTLMLSLYKLSSMHSINSKQHTLFNCKTNFPATYLHKSILRMLAMHYLFYISLFSISFYAITSGTMDTYAQETTVEAGESESRLRQYRPDLKTRTTMTEIQKKEAEKKAEEIVSKLIKPEYTEFEKILLLHEYITETMTYGKLNGETNSYTALVHQQSDCVGFARGFGLLLDKANIRNTVISRKKGHLWNQVTIRGKCYHIDTTWGNIKSKWNQFSWFLLNDKQNQNEFHTLDSNEKYPSCPDAFELTKDDIVNLSKIRSSSKIRIAGKLTLPDGMKAPAEGYIFYVNGARVVMLPDTDSVFFITSIPRTQKERPTLSYRLMNPPSNLAATGYYAIKGSTPSKKYAELPDSSGNDIMNLQFVVAKAGAFVSGTVSLPETGIIPENGLNITVQLDGYQAGQEKITYYQRVHLTKQQKEVPFRIDVDDRDLTRNFKLYYWAPAAEKYGYKKSGNSDKPVRFEQKELKDYRLKLE